MIKIAEMPLLRSLIIFFAIMSVAGLSAYLLAPLLIPIILSFALYALFNPVSNYLQRKGFNGGIAAILVLILLVVICIIGVSIVFPMLAEQLLLLQAKIPKLWEFLTNFSFRVKDILEGYWLQFDPNAITKPIIRS